MPTGKPDEPEAEQGEPKDNKPPWFAALPPEIRDAFAGGQFERIPARYRPLIEQWILWLQKNSKESR